MFSVLVGLQIFAILIILYTLVYMFRGSSTYAQKLMLSFMIAELVHNAGYLLELFAETEREAMMAVKFEYLGGSIVAIFFMMFIRNYCGLKERIVLERVLLLCGCAVIVMVWTSSMHTLYYRDVEFVNTGVYPHLKLTYGPGFYFYLLTCTVIPWGMSVLALIKTIHKERNQKRRGKLKFVIGGATFATCVLVLYVLRVFPEGYDPTPVAMAFMLFTLVVFVWNRKDFDLTRLAANTVLNSLSACMITLDENRKVLVYNDAAKQMFPDITIYKKISNVESFPMNIFESEDGGDFEIGDKYYEGHVRSLEDHEHIVRGYTVLIMDVTNTYEYVREVNEMREKAEEANRAKSDFLANMSHEIRTPMNAVVGMSELIIEESRGRKMYDYACDIKSAALNLLSIINDILDLSKVEAGKMELVENEYYVQVLIKDTMNLVHMAAEQKGLQMKVDVEDNIPHKLLGDEGRIRQVLINILNNSIKFTKNGHVSFAVSGGYIDDEHINLNFVIEDTGIGIKKEDMDSIFEAFRQLDMNKNRQTEGTGLGLPITKKLVNLMQGDIQVESEYGKGTRFIIQIRQKVVDKRTVREVPITRNSIEQKKNQMFVNRDYKVLVVDDNAINRKVAVAMLESYAFRIHEASSGKAAIEMVKKHDYDMIFMDHMMPEMDGVEAMRIIRSECADTTKNTVIVALTANAIQGAREMYLENGFEDFLSKPFERVQMYELLERWIPKEYREYIDDEIEEDKVTEDDIAELFMFGVNVREAVNRKNGGIEAYMRLLNEFRMDGIKRKPLLCKLAQEKDYEGYEIEVHALKCTSANIGADNLSKEAKEHEQAAEEGSYGYIDRQYAQLVVDYERILNEIERVLKRKKYGPFKEGKPIGSKPIDEGFLHEQLCQIDEQIKQEQKKDALLKIEDLLQYAIPHDVEELLSNVRYALELDDIAKAMELLNQN